MVDLVNNLDQLAESQNEVLGRVKERAASYNAFDDKLFRSGGIRLF